MSKISQIYAIVNDVAKMSMGEKGITPAVDTGSFVSLGDAILSSATDTENFMNTLVDRIGRTVFSVRRYQSNDRNMVRHPFEYGCIVQKIYVDLPEAQKNEAWEIGSEDYTPVFAPVIKPSVKQKFFNKISTWSITVTIPDKILKTAFANETAMATFIDAIFTSMDNMMELAMENNANLVRSHFIGEKIHAKAEHPLGAINLLHDYNTETNAGLTVVTCLKNEEFLKYASRQINLWSKRMSTMSTLFNMEGYKRHTPREDVVIDILQDFASATATYLESDTYHKELVALPHYNEVPFWMGSGETFAFDDCSKIDVKLNDETTVEQTGIIACIYDYEAMGVTLKESRACTERNNLDEYTDYANKEDIGYFADMSENGIVFYIAEV